MTKSKLLFFYFLCSVLTAMAQNKVIYLYEDNAPGSENWTYQERESTAIPNNRVACNVAKPSLTVFLPTTTPNGTAVIICPGGGFHTLSVDTEGSEAAQWLNKKGVTCFVLRYRTAESFTENPLGELMEKIGNGKLDKENEPIIPLAINDGKKAIEYVRTHANEYGIAPDRIGMMGFSAGGTVTMGVTFDYNKENRPDFIAPIYPYIGNFKNYKVPADAPPMFVCAASDDQLGLAVPSAELYKAWIDAKREAEIHIYSKGGHGYGMVKSNQPIETWMERFSDWLEANNWYKKTNPPAWQAAWKPEDFFKDRKAADERLKYDWASLNRFREANKTLAFAKKEEQRVVFLGNSITEGWVQAMPDFFAKKPYVNRGIGGQTTGQVLVRFRPDVINLTPKVLVLMIGINDIAENNGTYNEEESFGNIVSMLQLAQANQIKTILCSITPADKFVWRTNILAVSDKIISLNKRLKNYAAQNGIAYCDYYSAMVDSKNAMQNQFTTDGVHVTAAGYKVMSELVEPLIQKEMTKK